MDSMLATFITESRENLEACSSCFLALESDPTNAEILDDLFRSVHTMKGSSGLFDIVPFTKVVHAAEDVLDRLRAGELTLTSEHIDTLLDSMDQVGIWLDELEDTEVLAAGADELSAGLTKQLRAIMGLSEETADDIAESAPGFSTAELTSAPNWVTQLHHIARRTLYQELLVRDQHVNIVTYTPDEQCFFNGDDPIRLVQQCPGLVTFHLETRQAWPTDLAELDPFNSNLVLHVLTSADTATLHEHFRYVDDQIQMYQLDRQFLAFPEGDYAPTQAYQLFTNDANFSAVNLEWDKFAKQVAAMADIEANAPYQETILEWLVSLSHEAQPNARIIKAMLNAFSNGVFDLEDQSQRAKAVASSSFVPLSDALSNLTFGADGEEFDEDDTATVVLPVQDWLSTISSEAPTLSHEQQTACQEILDTQLHILRMPCEAHLIDGRIHSIAAVAENILVAMDGATAELNQAKLAALSAQSLAPMLTYFESLNVGNAAEAIASGSSQASEPSPAIEQSVNDEINKIGEQAKLNESTTQLSVDKASEPAPVAKKKSDSPAAPKALRVDQARIDNLMDLVGELVVAKNALPFLAKKAEEQFGVKALAKEIHGQYSVINRLSEDLQEAMMQVRMVPLSTVFQRFPRLVRDLSRKLDKNITLKVEGEETEADKNVVEELSDPLIHLVRNSLDHGLEMPSERLAKGKPEQGTITLRAIPREDQVLIEIVDDGKGINPEIMKRKAYEKGVIDEQRLDTITDQEALQLIFAPGFSTAEQVSDLSGRGVGMDVVRTVISQSGGSVHVESEVDKGTTIRLSLPLSMAVNRVMMIEVAEQSYGVGMQSIVETVKIPSKDVYRMKQDEAVILRGRVIPIFHLRQLLGLTELAEQPKELAILVILHDGQEVGLVIDDFHEGIDTIQKPLEGVMANYPYYSGTALLGDGRVLLVLNTQEILACR